MGIGDWGLGIGDWQIENNGNKISNLSRETETLTLTWDILFTLFDNVIIIKANNYNELHFRNGFIRCQDVKSPDYDRILAHSYYELYIKKNKNGKEIVRFKDETNFIKFEQNSEKLEKNKNDKKNNEKSKKEKIERLAKDKNKKNKNAIQETQLVKIEKYLDKENVINISRKI